MTKIEMLNWLKGYFMDVELIDEDGNVTSDIGYTNSDVVNVNDIVEYFDKEIESYNNKRARDAEVKAKKAADHADFDAKVLELIENAGEDGIANGNIVLALTEQLGELITTSKVSAAIKRINAEEIKVEKFKMDKKVAYKIA